MNTETETPAIVSSLLAFGFTEWQMGGGCIALGKAFPGPRPSHVLATGLEGAYLPDDEEWMIGFYFDDEEGEASALYASDDGSNLEGVFERIAALGMECAA